LYCAINILDTDWHQKYEAHVIAIARYLLAVVVVQTHLWPTGTDWTGQISVFAFYTLSGYLMTRVLNERYGFTVAGRAAFLVNRVLRLWPAYLIILAAVLLVLQYLPLTRFNFLIRAPTNTVDVVTNIAVLGQTTFDYLQWINQAKPLVTSWSLSIEIFSYLLLALYFAKSPARLWCFAIIGVIAMTVSTFWCESSQHVRDYGPYCFQNRYGVLQAGFVPFAFGGLYYFYQKTINYWLSLYRLASICALAILLFAMFFSGPMITATVTPFIGIPLTWILLVCGGDQKSNTAQDFFGRASYHLFIAHMPLAATILFGLGFRTYSFIIYPATIAAALVLSGFLVPLEWGIERVRAHFKRTAKIKK
jgi:peptidoglycan/LPS O-acetylase OafA/YrhL